MIRTLSIVGTRPEAIKMAPVIQQLQRHVEHIDAQLCVTGQHRRMLDQVLALFEIKPDYDLNLMTPDQTLSALTADLFRGIDHVVRTARPNWILAQGDTTTVMAAALVAFYHGAKFGHVEAGLRTGDLRQPFPEEMNRRVADLVAYRYFAPTQRARQTLLAEGVNAGSVLVTGNTVIDALQEIAERPCDWSDGPLAKVRQDRQIVLITAHRRESFGQPFREICAAIRRLADEFQDVAHFVYPVHLNPNVRRPVGEILNGLDNVTLMEPLDYLSLVHLMKRSTLILTDSGGIQEEAPGLKVPVLVMRETTERPEGVEAGVVRLVGTSAERIVTETRRLLRNADERAQMSRGVNPYGDGRAAGRIVAAILEDRQL